MITNKRLNKDQFAHLIPHVGSMSLIDFVDCWGDQQIICRSSTHKDPANPLRFNGTLSAIHLIEYGAQSMAIHGGLLSGKSSPGFLAAARNVHLYTDHLNDVNGELIITADAALKIHNSAVYDFTIMDSDQHLLLEARATVITL
ncbi:MAG: hypothetical protein HOP02_14365 [Methylococcaceae bacterium]|nr:hypothetical protein [Methylococcaceae bacterium]